MLEKDNAVLLVIDVQGKLATLMHEKDRLFKNINRMVAGAKLLGIPVIWTEQLPEKLGETVPEVKQSMTDIPLLTKATFSCCGGEGFDEKLKSLGRKQVLVTGIETHICVFQTCRDLAKDDYELHLVIDAVSSRLEHNYHLGVERIQQLGAIKTSVEMSLFEMMKVAEGDDFRQIVKIVK